MFSERTALRTIFERAGELSEKILDGDQKSLAQLNEMLARDSLGGTLVALGDDRDDAISSARDDIITSLEYPAGRLGGFAVRYDEEDPDPTFAVLLHDVRGVFGGQYFVPIDDHTIPYHVLDEISDSLSYSSIVSHLRSDEFSFGAFAKLCEDMGDSAHELSIFASAINDAFLPFDLASSVRTSLTECITTKGGNI